MGSIVAQMMHHCILIANDLIMNFLVFEIDGIDTMYEQLWEVGILIEQLCKLAQGQIFRLNIFYLGEHWALNLQILVNIIK